MTLLLAVLMGCGGAADPELKPYKDALDAWEEGERLLEAGEPESAQAAFAKARSHRPDDPVLASWEAMALAEQGETEAAVEVLDEVLDSHPGYAEARYNRASYLVRLGENEAAAEDLKQAIDDGARRSREVNLDPDFEAVLGTPEFSFLPLAALNVGVEHPPASVFWGTEFPVRFRIGGAGTGPIGITAEKLSGPVELLRVAENEAPSTAGLFRDITYTFRAAGKGTFEMGPLHVWAGERRVAVAGFSLELTAPPDKPMPIDLRPISLKTPQELAAAHPSPSARRLGTELVVHVGHGDRVDTTPTLDRADAIPYRMTERNQPIGVLWRYIDAPAEPIEVRVHRSGRLVLDARVD